MISAFYNAKSGVMAQNQTMGVISDNLANVSTVGFKGAKMGFSDLLYSNVNRPITEIDPLRVGNGVKNQQVGVSYETGSPQDTGGSLDFSIRGEGFFAVQNPTTEAISYSRDGAFHLKNVDDTFYLANGEGDLVLDADSAPITVTPEEGQDIGMDQLNIGVFTFPNKNGLLKLGSNRFMETTQSMPPEMADNSVIKQGALEGSNVDTATEIARVIEAQRAFQFNSRIIQMSDELEQTINNLR